VADLAITFNDIPLRSLNNAAFQALFTTVTLANSILLDLKGTADVVARTTIGDIPITSISFDVSSALKGVSLLLLLIQFIANSIVLRHQRIRWNSDLG
jgi:hypothetical protein